jgi:GGDEF domain-containing protein
MMIDAHWTPLRNTVILSPGVDLKDAATIAKGLCEVCEARVLVQQDPAGKFTISVGAGTEASGASELGGLLKQTDAALYRAKRAGGPSRVGAGAVCSAPVGAEHRAVPDTLGQGVCLPQQGW